MGKFNFGIDSTSAASEELGDSFYAGDTPPKGVYTCLVKQFKIKKNKNDNYRLSVLLEIQEDDDSEKAQYNGYGFWGGYNVTDEEVAKRFINNMLDGIGAKRTDFWAEKITTSPGKIDKDTAQDVLKIGTRKTTGHMVRVATKFKPASAGYEEGLEPQRFLTDEDVPQRAASEPDDDAQGLGGSDAGADDSGGDEAAGEGYTQEELEELEPSDLRAICVDWEIKHAPKATKATLIKLILEAQEAGGDEEPGEDESGDDADGSDDAGDGDDSEDLTEEDMADMSLKDLVEYMEAKEWPVPKKKVPSALRAAILQYQAEPPF